jgi:hypothetical protein
MISNVIFLLLAKAGMRSMGASGIDYGILGIILANVLMNSTSGVEFYFRKMCRAIVDKYKLRLTIMNLIYILSIALYLTLLIAIVGSIISQPSDFLNLKQGVNPIAHAFSFMISFAVYLFIGFKYSKSQVIKTSFSA